VPWRLPLGLHHAAAEEWDVARPGRIQKVKADPHPHISRTADLLRIPQFFVPSGMQCRHGGTTQKGLTWPLANANETPAGVLVGSSCDSAPPYTHCTLLLLELSYTRNPV